MMESKLKNYLVWNPQKVLPNGSLEEHKPTNIMHLMHYEMKEAASCSSVVNASSEQIEQMLTAVYNETDVQLKTAVIQTGTCVVFHPHWYPNKQGSVVPGFSQKTIIFSDHQKALEAARVWEDFYGMSTSVSTAELVL